MKNVLMAFGFALTTLTSFAQETTLWDVIQESENHNYLEQLILVWDYQDEILASQEYKTFFAPSDAAFITYAAEEGIEVDSIFSQSYEGYIDFFRHLGVGVFMSSDFYDGLEIPNANNEDTFIINVGENITINGVSIVTSTDVGGYLESVDAVVHSIDVILRVEDFENNGGEINSVGEIQDTQRPVDNNYYNVMGQRFDNFERIPFGTVYIFNGKQYIRTEN